MNQMQVNYETFMDYLSEYERELEYKRVGISQPTHISWFEKDSRLVAYFSGRTNNYNDQAKKPIIFRSGDEWLIHKPT